MSGSSARPIRRGQVPGGNVPVCDTRCLNQYLIGLQVSQCLEALLGPSDGDRYQEEMYLYVVSVCGKIVLDYSDTER